MLSLFCLRSPLKVATGRSWLVVIDCFSKRAQRAPTISTRNPVEIMGQNIVVGDDPGRKWGDSGHRCVQLHSSSVMCYSCEGVCFTFTILGNSRVSLQISITLLSMSIVPPGQWRALWMRTTPLLHCLTKLLAVILSLCLCFVRRHLRLPWWNISTELHRGHRSRGLAEEPTSTPLESLQSFVKAGTSSRSRFPLGPEIRQKKTQNECEWESAKNISKQPPEKHKNAMRKDEEVKDCESEHIQMNHKWTLIHSN